MYLGFADADAYVSQARTAECNNIKIQIEALAADPAFESEIYGLVEALRDKAVEETGLTMIITRVDMMDMRWTMNMKQS